MKKNYSAWKIQPNDFFDLPPGPERIKFLIKFAILAPSSHNSQPWKFEIGENFVLLKPNLNRHLAVSDPENRHLYIALGCALGNLLVAADYYSLNPRVEYFPAETKDAAAKIYFQPSSTAVTARPKVHLIFGITSRRSNRNKYNNVLPEAQTLEKIQKLSTDNVQISLVSNEKEKSKLTGIFMESRLKAFSNKAFRAEMASYKRNSFTSSYFGMPGFTMGINSLLSLIAPFLIRNFNIMKVIGKSEEAILKNHTPVFLFLSAKNHNPMGWLQTGQMLEQVLLTSEQNGLQTSMSALPLNIKPLQEILKTSYRPEMFVRLGFTKYIPGHAPRLKAEHTIEK